MEPCLQKTQKSTESGSKWNGSKGSSVNARPIRTNFGTVRFHLSVNGALVHTSTVGHSDLNCCDDDKHHHSLRLAAGVILSLKPHVQIAFGTFS